MYGDKTQKDSLKVYCVSELTSVYSVAKFVNRHLNSDLFNGWWIVDLLLIAGVFRLYLAIYLVYVYDVDEMSAWSKDGKTIDAYGRQ